MRLFPTGKPKGITVILMGQLMVNIPVTIIILLIAGLLVYLGLTLQWSVLAGALTGWYFWDKLLRYWKEWALKRGIEPVTLYKLGKWGLINFYRYKIFPAENKEQF